MHDEALAYIRNVLAILPPPRYVAELGSLIVNTSVRPLFKDASIYIGVDVRPGPGVDVVADGADWSPGDWLQFDAVITTEALEHTARAAEVVANAHRLLKLGGVLIVTCATDPRPPHGMDGVPLPNGEYYANVPADRLREWLSCFRAAILTGHERGDLYALAVK